MILQVTKYTYYPATASRNLKMITADSCSACGFKGYFYRINPGSSMNGKFYQLVFLMLFFCHDAVAQRPEDQLVKWAETHPVEKLYLHFDRDTYIAGETAWFKAYLSSDYLPDTISTSLYAELLNPDLVVIERIVLPVFAGVATGQFDLPDSLSTGFYAVRAFTRAMYAHSPDFIFKKDLLVHGKKIKETPATAQKIILDFFPEGGNLVTGFSNNVAFKAVYENGYPAPLNGVIKNSRGITITAISSYHDGMGMFELNPVAGEKYYAETTAGKTLLPDPVEKGIALNLMRHEQGFFYEIQQRRDDPVFMAAYFVGQMQHQIVFRKDLKEEAPGSLQGIVNTKQLRSGILQVTFFNKEGIPLAERLWFVDNKEYIQPVELLSDTVDFNAKARNRFRIFLKDTIQGNISVAIVDAAYTTNDRKENILTGLLLTSDIKGYVHQPAYYFSAESDAVNAATDLLMMTNGWRRFKWTGLGKPAPEIQPNPAYITLSGRAVLRGTHKAFAGKSLLLLIRNIRDRKKKSTHMLQTDRDGNFLVDSLIFFDRNLLLFSDTRGKKSQNIDIYMGDDSLHKNFSWNEYKGWPRSLVTAGTSRKWETDYDAIIRANGLMLEAVTVKSRPKTSLEELDEKYTRGLFSGDAVRAIDLVNSEDAIPYNNIFDYLQGRVNGLQVIADGAEYGIYYRQTSTISSMGNPPMTLFLDEIETDVSVIASIPANQVAYVKVYNNFIGAAGGGQGGALAVYTRKSEDYGKSGNYANIAFYNGYSVVKEFYAPDHRVPDKNGPADNRITIDWRPSIFINSINPRVPVSFYNNDRTKRFKVVVEGMTSSGKLIWLEKLVQ